MPNQDGTLTGADRIALTRAFDRMIPPNNSAVAGGAAGILDAVLERTSADPLAASAFMRVVEALSLDMLSHAVGGFSALTEAEQISSLRNIERTLPREFAAVLGILRDVYYEDERTPIRPSVFDGDDEVFGKVSTEDSQEPERVNRRRGASTLR